MRKIVEKQRDALSGQREEQQEETQRETKKVSANKAYQLSEVL